MNDGKFVIHYRFKVMQKIDEEYSQVQKISNAVILHSLRNFLFRFLFFSFSAAKKKELEKEIGWKELISRIAINGCTSYEA